MDFYQLPDYKKFAEAINKSRKHKYNLEIVTLPGSGSTFYLKRYFEKEKNKNLILITEPGIPLAKYNLIMADLALKPESVGWIEEYLRYASPDHKFCVLVNDPSREENYLNQHAYEKYYFGVQDRESMKNMAAFLGLKPTEKYIQKVLEFSGGFGQLAKYLFTHSDWDDKEIAELMKVTNDVVNRSDKTILEKLNIKGGYWHSVEPKNVIDLQIGNDLTLIENGVSGSRLTKIEADILKSMLLNEGIIQKDKVSEIKWPGTSYDKFSEQAINKTMRRLSQKLKHYQIEAIPKFGFKIILK